jgi:hypothetical protein
MCADNRSKKGNLVPFFDLKDWDQIKLAIIKVARPR